MADPDNLREIHRLLDEAYRHYFDNSDGHCKSSEGHISVGFGNYWDRAEGRDPLTVTSVEIYSYVLGPSRLHYFKSTDEALATVRKWHKNEMEFTPDADEELKWR